MAIASDLALFEIWERRLAGVAVGRDSMRRYQHAKAEAWLLLARTEYTDHDRTGIVDAAFAQATQLIGDLESGTATFDPPPVVTGSVRVREDLWSVATQLKSEYGMRCAASTVAQLEVRLLWAGNEHLSCGADDPRPHQRAAESLADRAVLEAAACPRVYAVRVGLALRAARPFGIDSVAPMFAVRGRAVILEEVTFETGRALLTQNARRILDEVARSLVASPGIRVEIGGHTDITGSRAVNLRLSRERAESVRQYLISRGVEAARLVARGYGPDQPMADNATERGRATNRRVELNVER